MTPTELAADLRTRINPLYATQIGTESYERRLCAEAIEGLLATVAERAAAKPPAVLMNQLVNDKLELSAKLAERDAEIEQLKSIAYSDDGAGGEGMKLFLQVRAQRKVLEQAFEALDSQLRCDDTCQCAGRLTITAIQEVLKNE